MFYNYINYNIVIYCVVCIVSWCTHQLRVVSSNNKGDDDDEMSDRTI